MERSRYGSSNEYSDVIDIGRFAQSLFDIMDGDWRGGLGNLPYVGLASVFVTWRRAPTGSKGPDLMHIHIAALRPSNGSAIDKAHSRVESSFRLLPA